MRNDKRINTNTAEFMNRVAAYISRYYPDINDLHHDSDSAGGIKDLIIGGGFDCYYSQAAESMAEWFQCSVDDIWSYYKEDGGKLWDVYAGILAKNIRRVLKKSGFLDI